MRVLFIAAVLLVPAALAHVPHDRPTVQGLQPQRTVDPALSGVNASFELLARPDALADHVEHVVDPKRGTIQTAYRVDLGDPSTEFGARWEILRLLEYSDSNENLQYDPGTDLVARSWRWIGYSWTATGPQLVSVSSVDAQGVVWLGSVPSGPRIRLEAVAAGLPFADEGAIVDAQDVLLYLDALEFPPRGVGRLHALEGVVHPSPGATARLDTQTNGTVGIRVEAPDRVAFLDWGAEAQIDRVEQGVTASLDAPDADGSQPFRIHFPIMESSLRMVVVAGVEYANPSPRAPGPGLAVVVFASFAAAAILAIVKRAR